MKVSSVDLAHYNKQNINFKRAWKEHQSWGVRVDENNPTVKVFAFPDAKKVAIEIENPFGKRQYELQWAQNGIFQTTLKKEDIKEGDKYRFVITKKDGTIEYVKDPYSFSQPTLLGASEAYDHSRFQWSDKDWYSKQNSKKIARNAGKNNNFKPIDAAKIYELHIATLTQKGNFEAAKTKLKEIKDSGFNAIEIMPTENTFSYNWGYDGVVY